MKHAIYHIPAALMNRHSDAIAAAARIRLEHEAMNRTDAEDAIRMLMEEHGVDRITRLVRHLAHQMGEDA